MARTDMLTGLYNRVRFTEFVEREIARTRRTGKESCLVMLDLDHFKNVNDIFGHPNGDTVLECIAGVMKSQLRDTDILARFGGEEFTILLQGTSVDGALKVAEKVRLAIEHCTFPDQMEKLKLTASFGIAPLSADANATFDSVYREADKALYRAKDKWRNRIECA
jgi:two-component system, cell cycle response regulator